MNWKHVCNNWPLAVDRIRITWSKLSDADIATIQGDRVVLATLLQSHYRVGEEKAELMIVNFTARMSPPTAGLRGSQ